MARGKSRPARWAEAVAAARAGMDEVEAAKAKVVEAFQELESLRSEYEEKRDNVPENLQSSPYYEKLDNVANLDFSEEDDLSTMSDTLDEAEVAELPLGFGRD